MVNSWSHPILRWAGSKRKLLPILHKNVPISFNRYVEPFCGSACLFFSLNPEKAILGDINPDLIHTYSIIKKHPRLLARRAKAISNDDETYYATRDLDPEDLQSIDRAVRFIYLNRFCFNGVYRTNKAGKFNVPKGTRTGIIPSEARFYRCHIALRNAQILECDFQNIIDYLEPNDFIYLDPPYAKHDSIDRGEYGPNSFKYKDFSRLEISLDKIIEKGANFLLSYAATDEVVSILEKKWYVKKIKVKRHVAGFARFRETVTEILASNNPIFCK